MCNVSFHIVVVTVVIGSVCNITSAHKLCLSQPIPHCKGEQHYGGVTLFVRTDICSVQDQMTLSVTGSDSYTDCDTCACDVKGWCHK